MIYLLIYLLGVILSWFLVAYLNDIPDTGSNLSKVMTLFLILFSFIGILCVFIGCLIAGITVFLENYKVLDFILQPSFKYFKRKKL